MRLAESDNDRDGAVILRGSAEGGFIVIVPDAIMGRNQWVCDRSHSATARLQFCGPAITRGGIEASSDLVRKRRGIDGRIQNIVYMCMCLR